MPPKSCFSFSRKLTWLDSELQTISPVVVGNSDPRLILFFFFLGTLLAVCLAHVWFRGQPETSAECTYRIWSPLLCLFSFQNFTFTFYPRLCIPWARKTGFQWELQLFCVLFWLFHLKALKYSIYYNDEYMSFCTCPNPNPTECIMPRVNPSVNWIDEKSV